MNGDDQQPSGHPMPAAAPAEQSVAPQPMSTPQPESFVRPAAAETREISWTASEFVSHEKTAQWYGLLMLAALGLAGVAYLVTHDLLAVGAIIIVGIIFGYVAGHKPRVLNYQLDEHGLTIAHKIYPYGSFRSFFVVDEGAFSSVTLMPLKRFMPPLSIYYAPQDQDKIFAVLGQHLPMALPSHDLIDRFMRTIKF